MIEIKFRAWYTPKDDRFLRSEMLEMSNDTSYSPRFWSKQGHIMTFNFFDPDLILMQFTGLKDKNGKEIYEGDILAEFGEVWFSPECSFCIKGGMVPLGMFKTEVLEVIGNIYENPELLK